VLPNVATQSLILIIKNKKKISLLSGSILHAEELDFDLNNFCPRMMFPVALFLFLFLSLRFSILLTACLLYSLFSAASQPPNLTCSSFNNGRNQTSAEMGLEAGI